MKQKEFISKVLGIMVCIATCLAMSSLPAAAASDLPQETVMEAAKEETEEVSVSTFEELRSALASAIGTAESPAKILLSADIMLTEPLSVPSGVCVCLQSDSTVRTLTKGYTTTSSYSGLISVQGTLYLSNLILDGGGTTSESAVYVAKKSKLYVGEGCILQNCCRGVRNAGDCYIQGGIIKDNYATGGGGGIYNTGNLYMESGEISSNWGTLKSFDNITNYNFGGGVYNTGYFLMTGGTIKDNLAAGGGGVYSTGTFVMKESGDGVPVISSNESKHSKNRFTGASCGGGVYVASGTFDMEGGTIKANRANNQSSSSRRSGLAGYGSSDTSTFADQTACMGDGGGVYISNLGAVFTMTGGTISGNYARGNGYGSGTSACEHHLVRQGAGVYVQGGLDADSGRTGATFRFFGGTITGNNASSKEGSGVYIGSVEYAYSSDSSAGNIQYSYTGMPTVEIGGNPSVSGNTADQMYVPEGMRLQIVQPLESDAHLEITAVDTSPDAVLAVYADDVTPDEAHCGCFLTGMRQAAIDSENRTIYLGKMSLTNGYEASVEQESYTYTGSAIEPEVTVQDDDGNVLVSGTDYIVTYKNQTAVGTAGFNVSGINDFCDSLQGSYQVTPKDLSADGSQIVVTETDLTTGSLSYTYDGKEKKPAASLIQLKDEQAGKYLNRNRDFTITYENAAGPGTACVVITGIGNYTGELRFPYEIQEAAKDKWMQSGNRWWYRHADGSYTKNGWEQIGGKWYHFDKDGWMQTYWQKIGGKWYYLGGTNDGVMKTGWQKIEGKWYYLGGANDGVMKTGWQKIGGKWYYLGGANDGVMKTGWQKIGGKWYYLGGANDGVMKTGWQQINGKWYYMNSSGVMVTGTQQINGKTYQFDSSGRWIS